MIKVNFGCGSIQPGGWINVDSDPEFNAIPNLDAINNGSVDIIVAHASIQQIDWHELVECLELLRSKLKEGGVIRISLPDIERGFTAYKEKDIDWFPNSEPILDFRFSSWLTWYSTSCTLLTSIALGYKLYEAGFYDSKRADFKKTYYDYPEITELDTRENEFYFMEARK